MLHWHQIWTRMRKITNKEIEKRAIMKIIDYFEPQIDAVIKQSAIELEKLNDSRVAQSLDPKIRIDEYCIKKAIKTIYSKDDYPLPKKVGGKIKKEKKDFEKHSQDSESLMEVV